MSRAALVPRLHCHGHPIYWDKLFWPRLCSGSYLLLPIERKSVQVCQHEACIVFHGLNKGTHQTCASLHSIGNERQESHYILTNIVLCIPIGTQSSADVFNEPIAIKKIGPKGVRICSKCTRCADVRAIDVVRPSKDVINHDAFEAKP